MTPLPICFVVECRWCSLEGVIFTGDYEHRFTRISVPCRELECRAKQMLHDAVATIAKQADSR